MEQEITLTMLVVMAIILCTMTIFRMKFKRDMYIAHLKNYGEGTSLIDDNIIKKLFDIQDD